MEKVKVALQIFNVVSKEYLTPHYIRVTLNGVGVKDFAPCTLGANNKIFVPPVGTDKVYISNPAVDPEMAIVIPADLKPIMRTYTHRAIDLQKEEIVIDFVDHGDIGPASAWARRAKKGDELGVAMKLVSKALCPAVDWYLLAGDATAIPVLSCILESLPATAKGYCVIEVASPAEILSEVRHEGFTIEWVFTGEDQGVSSLVEAVQKVNVPHGHSHFAYVACEYSSVKAIRAYFKESLRWSNTDFYAFSYWKKGESEDKSGEARRQEKE